MDPLAGHLRAAGFCGVYAVELRPNDGEAPIAILAAQLAAAVTRVRAEVGTAHVDLVGFSMGALVSRYFIQRLEGRAQVRRFVSISGPHQGTVLAWARGNAGASDMRPGSALLRELAADENPFAGVDVFAFWTPLDLMIVPSSSSRLPGAIERTFSVPGHWLMLRDGRVLRSVTEALRMADPKRFETHRRNALPPGL
ncbi:MAG: lipase [Myxococcaceae bacterium]|nr:lipase [Myxococcaceae bacterium]MCI0670472.1 lipase [Myxococcaceae bacterium]